MKKILAVLLVLFVSVTLFVACGEKKDDTGKAPENTTETAAENKNETNQEKTPENTETPANPDAKMFDGKLISFEIPEGFSVKEEGTSINVSNEKDPMKAVAINILENNPAPISEVVKQMQGTDLFKNSKPENVKIGNYEYVQLTYEIMSLKVESLMLSQNNNFYSITVNGMDAPEIQKLLASIVIK